MSTPAPALPDTVMPDERGIVRSGGRWRTPLLIGTATLGTVRIEWHNAMMHCVLPVNISSAQMLQPYAFISPMRYHVAEAQNLIVKHALERDYEWVWLLEDDVVIPPNTLIKFGKWIEDGRFPVVSGWYNVKSVPPQPMFFRGRGNGTVFEYPKQVKGEPINPELGLNGVLCDGVPTGCLLVSTKLLKVAWENSKEITLTRLAAEDGSVHQIKTREVFRTERDAGIDPETGGYFKRLGTSDLEFCDRVIDQGWLREAGFDYAAGLEWPFPVDTDIACGHIDLTTGAIY